jgi:hypothetical protein
MLENVSAGTAVEEVVDGTEGAADAAVVMEVAAEAAVVVEEAAKAARGEVWEDEDSFAGTARSEVEL